METPLLVQEPWPDLIRDAATSEMPISLVQDMNVEISDMIISSNPTSLVRPSFEYRNFPGIFVSILTIQALMYLGYALESLVIPPHLRVADFTLQVSTVEERFAYRLGLLVSGTCLLTWASTLSTLFAFYCISSCVSGLLMASFILLYQVVKRLPKELSYSSVFMYLALIGLTVVILPYISGCFQFIREATTIKNGLETFAGLVLLFFTLNVRLGQTQLGLIVINSELLLANDGSIDIGISHVMSWFIWIWGAVLILESSEDACLAGGTLVCVLAVSPLLRMITRFIFTQSLRSTLMAKLLIMRDAIRDAVGPTGWAIIIVQIYFQRSKEELERSYVKMEAKEDDVSQEKVSC